MRFKIKESHRIFVGPVEIAGIASGLVQGFKECGVDAAAILSTPHPFNYGNSQIKWSIQVWQKIGAARLRTSRSRLIWKIILIGAHKIWAWVIFLHLFLSFDIFVFLFGQTITDTELELWLIKTFKKKIIFIYLGSDSRPPYMDGGHFPGVAQGPLPPATTLRSVTRRRKKKILLHEKYANYLVNSPATAHFHERPYINWFFMGLPRALPMGEHISPLNRNQNRLIRILHSPSHPLVKGTAEILNALDRLREKGYQFEAVKIQGMPNEVVLKELACCDFVVDQMYSDTPLATFATEAAFFGKPAIVGGYFAHSIEDILSTNELPPSLFVTPDGIEAAIERLIVNVDFREELGKKARQFVLSQWSPIQVASRYLRLLNDDAPPQWWRTPESAAYIYGCGLPEGRARRLVALLISHFGANALEVHDKPYLEAALVNFARINEECTHA